MAPTLSSGELADLVEIVRSGNAEEKDTALRLLGPIVRSRDTTVQSRLPSDWKPAAWTVLREQTFTPAGTLAWTLLLHVDREAVNKFLIKIPVANLSEAERALLIGRLCRAPRAEACAKFREIEALGGHEAAEARRQRENLGGVDDEVLQKVAADWRQKHSRETLNRLLNIYVNHLPAGTPIAPLLKLLGTPSQQSPHDYRWATDEEDPVQLAVFTDNDDHLDGWKLK
jgi:hypothetical protein